MTEEDFAAPHTGTRQARHDPTSRNGPLRQGQVALEAALTSKMTIKQVISASGPMTLGVFVGLQVLDSVDGAMFSVFAPEIRESLSLDSTQVAIVGSLAGILVALGALPLGLLGDRRRRTTIAGVCTLVWAAAAAFLGMVQSFWQVATARTAAGIGKANEPIQASILVDAYPPAGRGRVLGMHRNGQPIGIIAGPLIAAIFAVAVPDGHEPWRWAFAFLAVPALILGLAALRLREPARGRVDQQALLGDDLSQAPNILPVAPRVAFARIRKIRTFYYVMVALGAFGLCVTTVPTFLSLILEDHLGQGPASRGVIASVSAIGGLAGATFAGIYSDRLFRRSPVSSLYLAGGALAILGIGFAIQAYAPNVATYIIVGTITQAMLFAGLVPLSLIVASITPPEFRATAFALVSLFLALVGGFGGAVLTGLAEALWGTQAAVAVVAPAGSVLAGLVLTRGAKHLRHDIARVTAGVLANRN